MSKRKCLSIAEKFDILNEVNKGIKKKDIAERYGIPTSSLSTILKNRDNIFKQVESNNLFNNRKRIKVCVYEEVDKAVLKWINSKRKNNLPTSSTLIKEKAIYFAQKLGFINFRASSGWLDKFKLRHNIVFKVICGESADISEENLWKNNILPKLIEKFDPNDIFNANETGLFYKCLPNKSLAFKHEKSVGVDVEHCKERVTLMVCSNMSGTEKQKLLIIGESQNPRCFEGIKSLETNYDFNKKALMTSNIFEKWLLDIDNKMSQDKRKIILFVSNCTAHPRPLSSKLKSVTLAYFPPNTKSMLQPMEQGIINNLKVYYRKRILNKVIFNTKNKITITLQDCISEVSKAWSNDVTSETIEKCFSKAGFKNKCIVTDVEVPDVQREWEIVQCDGITLQDYLKIDEDIAVYESPTDDKIVEFAIKKEIDEDENDSVEEPQKLTEKEILNALSVVRNGLRQQINVPDEMFIKLNEIETFFEKTTIFKNNKQIKFTNYFD